MARFVHYRCPECHRVFRHLHHPSEAPPPERCPLCNAWVSDDEPPEPVFVPQAPGIRKSAYAASVDQTYRAMEESSRHRADEAAGALEDAYRAQAKEPDESGLIAVTQKEQVAQLRSELKITNMKDPSQMREGDTAAISPAGAAERLTSTVPAGPGLLGASRPSFQMPAGQAPALPVGQRNAEFVSRFTQDHNGRAHAMIRAGRIN